MVINCRNNKKLLGRVKAFDQHCNTVLENVKEEQFNMVPLSASMVEDRLKQEECNTDPLSAVRENVKEMWTKLPEMRVLELVAAAAEDSRA